MDVLNLLASLPTDISRRLPSWADYLLPAAAVGGMPWLVRRAYRVHQARRADEVAAANACGLSIERWRAMPRDVSAALLLAQHAWDRRASAIAAFTELEMDSWNSWTRAARVQYIAEVERIFEENGVHDAPRMDMPLPVPPPGY
jgi:hypothetical protein